MQRDEEIIKMIRGALYELEFSQQSLYGIHEDYIYNNNKI